MSKNSSGWDIALRPQKGLSLRSLNYAYEMNRRPAPYKYVYALDLEVPLLPCYHRP